MTVTYSIIAQAFMKQRKALKTLANATRPNPQSYTWNYKTFLVWFAPFEQQKTAQVSRGEVI